MKTFDKFEFSKMIMSLSPYEFRNACEVIADRVALDENFEFFSRLPGTDLYICGEAFIIAHGFSGTDLL